MGFKVVEIASGSIFEDLGIQKDDIIHSVNGRSVKSAEDALNAYRRLRTSKSFQLSVLRNGRPVSLNLSVQ
jgi:general secretion pathway protein C